MKNRRNKKGFTIVELVITIAVIGILTAILVPTFINLTRKANQESDNSLVANLNKALRMGEVDTHSYEGHVPSDKNNTMQDAIDDLKVYGFNVNSLVTRFEENKLFWNAEDNTFYANWEDAKAHNTKQMNLWSIESAMPEFEEGKKHSIYAGPSWTLAEVPTIVGFDVGEHNDITAVNYTNSVAQDVVIRTNGGTLTINAEHDSVHHYGEANIVDIQKVATSSYHEHEKSTFVKISQGRFVMEKEAEVGGVHVSNDNVILAQAPEADLPAITIDSDISTFVLQTTDSEGDKVTESVVTVTASDNISTAASAESTAVPADVSAKVERVPADGQPSIVKTDEQAEESAAESVVPSGVARIGAIGYETFNAAVTAAAGTTNTIYLLKDFELKDSVGVWNGNSGSYDGVLNNTVKVNSDIKITFIGSNCIVLGEQGRFEIGEDCSLTMLANQSTLAGAGIRHMDIPNGTKQELDEKINTYFVTIESSFGYHGDDLSETSSIIYFAKDNVFQWKNVSTITAGGQGASGFMPGPDLGGIGGSGGPIWG